MPIATGIRPDRLAAALQYLQDMGNKRESVIDESGREYTIPAKGEAPAWYDKALPMEGRATFLPFQDSAPGSVMNKRELALPGIVAGAVNALTAPGRAISGSDPTFNAPEEAANVAMNVMGSSAGGVVKPAPAGQLGMTAYHGSPHTFDKFSLDKIGTGEGAQAYGHGLYLAEHPNVAEAYKSAGDYSTRLFIDGKENNLSPAANSWLVANQLNPAKALADAKAEGVPSDVLGELQSVGSSSIKWGSDSNAGNLYKTDIPDEAVARFLDWDKPLSQQAPEVQKAFGEVDPNGRINTGLAYERWRQQQGVDPSVASEKLKALGIPGIRYLDGGSRPTANSVPRIQQNLADAQNRLSEWADVKSSTGEIQRKQFADQVAYFQKALEDARANPATSNFVAFDPEMIRILERNGVPTGAQAWKPGEYQGKLAELLSNGNKE